MPRIDKANQRYQRIHEIFTRRMGKHSNGIKLADLADELGVSIRQLSTDIKYLKEQGAPLEYVATLKAWRYKEGQDFVVLEDQLLNDRDLSSLQIALATFSKFNMHDERLSALPEVFRKIYKASRSWMHSGNLQKNIYFDPLPKYDGAKHLTFFLKAIEESRRVEFNYLAFHAEEPKTVVFDPWFLRNYDQRWYVGGFSHDPEEQFVRVFPLERIEGVPSYSGFCHEKPRDYNAETYWKNIYGITVPRDGKVETITLKFTPIQGKYFLSSPFFEPYNIVENSPERLVIQLNLIVNMELIRKVASFGEDVEVLEPESLRNNLKEFFKKALSSLC
ncbi:MAG: transcriptional regulator [Chitinophagales bacterium]|nr:transcriptional regulator [Chitinophagales bacterium]